MPTVEILFKVGDGGGANFDLRKNWKDGMAIEIVPEGIHVLTADFNSWFNTPGNTPPGWLTVTKRRREMLRRWIARMRYLLDPQTNARKAAKIRFNTNSPNPDQEEHAQGDIDGAQAQYDEIQVHGFDTNWSVPERTIHGLILADLNTRQRYENTTAPIDENIHPYAPRQNWALRPSRVPYETLLTGQALLDIQSSTTTITLDRGGTVFSNAQVFEDLVQP